MIIGIVSYVVFSLIIFIWGLIDTYNTHQDDLRRMKLRAEYTDTIWYPELLDENGNDPSITWWSFVKYFLMCFTPILNFVLLFLLIQYKRGAL